MPEPKCSPSGTNSALERPVAGKFPSGINTGTDFKPFTGVEWHHIRTFKNGHRFHIIAYRAYDAFGLIGSEHNGVAIVSLSDDPNESGGDVVTVGMQKSASGYCGLTQKQLDFAYELAQCTWQEFCDYVNASSERRFDLITG